LLGDIGSVPNAARLFLPRHNEREPWTDISQVELQLHGLRDATRRSLHQLRAALILEFAPGEIAVEPCPGA